MDHPPARSQYRSPRRDRPSGVVVVHTAESTPDYVAFDGGAEAVARFIQGRSDPGSYHDLADSDSCLNLVPYGAEAYHDGTGSNRHSYGVSVATRADVWPLAPREWRDGAIRQAAAAAARYAAWARSAHGVVIPARRITRAQSEQRVPGFISHGERDPGRRTDPGAQFPWDDFLAEFARLTSQPTTNPGDVMNKDQEAKLDRVLASLRRIENEHFPDVERAVDDANEDGILVVPEDWADGDAVFYVAESFQSKLQMAHDGPVHQFIKDLHVLSGKSVMAQRWPQDRLDGIPTVVAS